ncbi:SDR family NAD(P)-dependent oxidoreductase [Microbacterium sp. No. 7]|uniref:SDR family NAD(P)-dependent oxidoreductase n=1 Tax=Microbacterium sp. No. 7 TaxID=1714373 RepID=UPI0006D13FBE|nr:SDR family NAD(P)-dependent oxidoreductase [Microbacterium sp. No. 7]ALJ20854.1 hypothetical protein AOA12_13445 [Microbacterium sp. No. 7]
MINDISHGPVALVTGASGGIGGAICRRLVADGYRLAVTDIVAGPLDAIVEEFGADRAVAFVADLLDEEAVTGLPARVHEEFGRLDVLVNNAGVRKITPFDQLPSAEWRTTLEIDLVAPALLAANALPLMLAQGGGRIVNIASFAGLSAVRGRAAYGAAKAGLISLTKAIALEFGAQGVRVNAIAPGIIETAMTSHVFASAELQRHVAEVVPNGRPGTPDDIADAVSFLASDRSDYVNGVVLPVDGGWLAGQGAARL